MKITSHKVNLTLNVDFKQLILQGIQTELPEPKPFETNINQAPKRKAILNAEEKNVVLNWSTASEHNNDFYTVERSTNAMDWEAISFFNAIGNSYSIANYSIFDSSPLSGISYYRLKQTDKDGQFSYSSSVSINIRVDLPNIVKRINVYGEELDQNATGLIIEIYDNGTIKKLFK
jgi:hypothetical protein